MWQMHFSSPACFCLSFHFALSSQITQPILFHFVIQKVCFHRTILNAINISPLKCSWGTLVYRNHLRSSAWSNLPVAHWLMYTFMFNFHSWILSHVTGNIGPHCSCPALCQFSECLVFHSWQSNNSSGELWTRQHHSLSLMKIMMYACPLNTIHSYRK